MYTLSRMWLRIRITACADTTSYEMFAGWLALSLGLALLWSGYLFPPGESFEILFIEGYTTTQLNWGLSFTIVGLSRLLITTFAGIRARKWMTLVSLYFWLLIVFYLVKFGYHSIFVIFPFIWLAFSSVYTFISLGTRLNGTL